jgi:drug/metabolite transporter (DMT)-like permease
MTFERMVPMIALVLIGAGWALTHPLGKMVLNAGYPPIGIIAWQLVIGSVVTFVVLLFRGRRLPFTRKAFFFWLMLALIGTLIPNFTSFSAMQHLPAGIMSIVIATIPMMSFPIALLLGIDQFLYRRLLGLCLGLAGVSLIALPEASLPDRAMVAVLPLALVAPLFYAIEGNVVAKWGMGGQGPLRLLCGASIVGACIAVPIALQTGTFIVPQYPLQTADWAMFGSSVIHVTVYTSYVWLVGRAGSVFAGQVSYMVTGFGVIWAMLLLGERFSGWIWVALVLMCLGLLLVQPRQTTPLATDKASGDTDPT